MEKDLNGIEYILMLILERIKETGVSQTKVTYGICDSGLIRKLSNGGGRKVDKTVIDVFMQRLGMNTKSVETFLNADEYRYLEKREQIRAAIDKDDVESAEGYIKEYEQMKLTNIDRQFVLYFTTHVLALKKADLKDQIELTTDAIAQTIPHFIPEEADKYLYSDVEMQLACHLAILNLRIGDEIPAVIMMEKLYSLMETKVYCENSMHKFAQIIYELVKYKNKTGDYEGAVKLCRNAVEKMPRENRFRFLPQIFKEKAKAEVSRIVGRVTDNENVKKLYENSLDYRYYKMLNSIYEMFNCEFNPDEYYFLVREYNAVPIGKIIKQRRQLMNMTQEEIIVADGYTDSEEGLICSLDTISRIENGKVSASWKVTRQLLEKVNLPPARFFGYYLSSNIDSVKEVWEIEKSISMEKYSETREMLKSLEQKNKYRNLPYNKMYVYATIFEIENGLNNADNKEAAFEMLKKSFEGCLPDYRTNHENIFLLMMELTIFYMIMGKMSEDGTISVGEKIKDYKKIIESYEYLGENNDLYIRHLSKILLIYEGNIANEGELEQANKIIEKTFPLVLKHDFFGVISGYIFDYAWNHVKQGNRDEKYGDMVNCAYAISKLMNNLPDMKLYRNYFFREFNQNTWDDLF